MKNEEKFAVVDALQLTAQEVLVYLQTRVSKICPVEMAFKDEDGNWIRSFEYLPRQNFIGFIIDGYCWSKNVVSNPDKLSWNARMEWLQTQEVTLGGKPAFVPTIPQLNSLAKNRDKIQKTIELIRLFGNDIVLDDFVPGKYLTSSGGNNQEGVYPRCIITEDGQFETGSPRSKTSPNDDIIRLVTCIA